MSERLLRLAAWLGVVGFFSALTMAALATIADSQRGMWWSLVAIGFFAALPYLAMRAHLRFSRDIDEAERTAWNSQSWGLLGILAAPFYLLRRNRRLLGRQRR